MKKIIVINGPNLNLLGKRQPEIYGSLSLNEIVEEISKLAENLDLKVDFFTSNYEGELIEKVHSVLTDYDGAIINAGAFTHYSYALYDAIKAVNKPFIEVHMSNVFAREEFRSKSVLSAACIGVICGFGSESYLLAVKALVKYI